MKAKRCDKIIEFANRKRCDFNSQSTHRLIGIVIIFATILSFIAATRFVTLIAFTIFKELNIDVKANQVVNTTPSHQHMFNAVHDTATEVLIISRNKTYSIAVYLSMDAANKEGIQFMVK